MKKLLFVITCCLAATEVPNADAAASGPQYRLIDLGLSGPDYLESFALRINNAGQITGFFVSTTGRGGNTSFLFENGKGLVDLDAIVFGQPGGNLPIFGLTETGVLLGSGFIYRPGVGTVYPEPLVAWYPQDQNRAGMVVGTGGVPDRVTQGTQAFYYTESQGTVHLGAFDGSLFQSGLNDVNENGLAVGASAIAAQDGQFVERNVAITFSIAGGMQEISIPGSVDSAALAVNDAGTIAGHFRTEGSTDVRGFIRQPSGSLSAIGALGGDGFSFPSGMNESGDVVGSSNYRAFLYSETVGIVDLGQFIPANSDWIELTYASDINDRGEIVGRGLKRVLVDPEAQLYETRGVAFLLRPIPEPATCFLFVVGLAAVVSRGHRGEPRRSTRSSLPFSA